MTKLYGNHHRSRISDKKLTALIATTMNPSAYRYFAMRSRIWVCLALMHLQQCTHAG